jgi:hypothetical protein
VNFTVAASQTATVDVYADLTTTGITFNSTLTGNGLGVTSNQSVTLTQATGQSITVGNGTLQTLTLSNSSPVSQIIVGGTTGMSIATYNFVASTAGGATITELGFSFATSTGASTAISKVTVGGSSAAVSGGVAKVTGLNIAVPATYGGVDIPVTVDLTSVGLNGQPDQIVNMALSHVKYLSGNNTYVDDASAALNGVANFTGGDHDGLFTHATTGSLANPMQLAGVAPVVSLTANSGSLTTGTVKVGSVTIVAPTGNVTLYHLPITLGVSGATISSSTQIVVKDPSNGNNYTLGSSLTPSANDGHGTATIDFGTSGYTISAGSTGKTFDIYVNVASIAGNAGTGRVTLGLGDNTTFTWKDVNGNTNLTGAQILNYPNTTVSIVN